MSTSRPGSPSSDAQEAVDARKLFTPTLAWTVAEVAAAGAGGLANDVGSLLVSQPLPAALETAATLLAHRATR